MLNDLDEPLHKPVLAALLRLKRVEGHATTAKIARLSGCPIAHVYRVLDENHPRINRDQRDRITGTTLDRLWRDARDRAIAEGRAYVITPINYGTDREITCQGPVRKELERSYWFGSLGDSYEGKVILATDANLAEVRRRGLVHLDELRIDRWEPWIEGPAEGARDAHVAALEEALREARTALTESYRAFADVTRTVIADYREALDAIDQESDDPSAVVIARHALGRPALDEGDLVIVSHRQGR